MTHFLFPTNSIKSHYNRFELFCKKLKPISSTNPVVGHVNYNVDYLTLLYLRNSFNIIKQIFKISTQVQHTRQPTFDDIKRWFISEYKNLNSTQMRSGKVKAEAELKFTKGNSSEIKYICQKPSVYNIALNARNYIAEVGKNKNASLNIKNANLQLSTKNKRIPNLPNTLTNKLSEICKVFTNDELIKLFLILFSKTISDLSQIIFTINENKSNKNPSTYFLTFDKMAGLIALLLKCRVIFTGESSHIPSTANNHEKLFNKKVGYAVIGPHNIVIKQNSKEKSNNINNFTIKLRNANLENNKINKNNKNALINTLRNMNNEKLNYLNARVFFNENSENLDKNYNY